MSWENLFLPYVNNKGADQPEHPHSPISAFVVHCLDSTIPLVSISEISSLYLAPVAGQVSLSLTRLQTPKDRFSHYKAQLCSLGTQWHSFVLKYLLLQKKNNLCWSTTKSTKSHVRPVKTQISLVSAQSDQSRHCWPVETLGPWLPTEWTANDWSDWADARADLSLRWAHRWFCWFCHAVAHLISSMLPSTPSHENVEKCFITAKIISLCKFGLATFFSWNNFYGHSVPTAASSRAVDSHWQKKVHLVLVNCLPGLSLPR